MMRWDDLKPKQLDEIVGKMMNAVRVSQNQIFQIVQMSHQEKEAILRELDKIKREVNGVIDEVETWERKSRHSRRRLAEVSRNFHAYDEAAIKEAYQEANRIHLSLFQMQEREQRLRQRRDELELRLKTIERTIEKAESVLTQVSIVLHYLSGEMTELGRILESAQQQRALGLKIILAKEEESRRVAREIHDGPAQSMANVVLRTEIAEMMMKKGDIQAALREINELKESVKNTLSEVRQIIFNLRPMALDDLGLIPALREYLSDIEERFKIKTSLDVSGRELRLQTAVEVAIFRMVQESLNNVVKHAEATNASVSVRYHRDRITLTIVDNGKGFDVETAMKERNHFGLTGMTERAELLNGSMEIVSGSGGTRLLLTIPVTEEMRWE